MSKNLDIDKLDRKILSLLMEDAKTPYTDIAKKLEVSGGTIHVRMKKLEQIGLVKGASLVVDHELLGYDILAYLGIYLDKSSMYDRVIEKLREIPEVISANYTTGQYGVFVKVIVKDTNDLRRILNDRIQIIDGIQRTETFISLEESINRPIQVNL